MQHEPFSARVESHASAPSDNVTGTRIVAAIIDLLLLSILFSIMVVLFGETESTDGPNGNGAGFQFNLTGMPFVVYLFLAFAYYAVTEAVWSATPGKLVMRLRVQSADGGSLSTGQVLLRNVLRIIDSLPFLYLVGIVIVAVSKRQQRLGDLAARTVVVRATPGSPASPL